MNEVKPAITAIQNLQFGTILRELKELDLSRHSWMNEDIELRISERMAPQITMMATTDIRTTVQLFDILPVIASDNITS